MAGSALAESDCKQDYHFCGKNLAEKYGDYDARISASLERAGMDVMDHVKQESLFFCKKGGQVIWQQYCDSCVINNSWGGASDFCDENPDSTMVLDAELTEV
ncbi:hypothetical protein QQS21_010607 [Conoideocrella luteorostrata]|uniref:Uncharacterized protein n=1 Tax=Conoideocrella luteorostrata TaxID=1105319 RepID=A0AAJ0CEN4_9HYPO|nr:hypothetical protein QQS21_010607 [Conoideocrella luteorostrata]